MNWFTRKSNSRRSGRTHVLDVKASTRQVRAARFRVAAISLAVIFSTVVGFYAVWKVGEWSLDRLIYKNSAFAIRNIDVQTDGVIAAENLRRWSGAQVGGNLMALDLGRVKRDLELVQFIRTVAVERVMPHTLRLRVMEREPVAQIYLFQARPNGGFESTILHVDADGFVMRVLDPRLRTVPANPTNDVLPVIIGLDPGEPVPGRALKSARAKMALKLIVAFNRSSMASLVDLQQVNVSSPDVLEVTTMQGSQITFSLNDFDRQLGRWRAVYDQGKALNKSIACMDLSVPSNIPLKWAETGPAPPAGNSAKNTQRNRKKNV